MQDCKRIAVSEMAGGWSVGVPQSGMRVEPLLPIDGRTALPFASGRAEIRQRTLAQRPSIDGAARPYPTVDPCPPQIREAAI
jgi:hypothetical protein